MNKSPAVPLAQGTPSLIERLRNGNDDPDDLRTANDLMEEAADAIAALSAQVVELQRKAEMYPTIDYWLSHGITSVRAAFDRWLNSGQADVFMKAEAAEHKARHLEEELAAVKERERLLKLLD